VLRVVVVPVPARGVPSEAFVLVPGVAPDAPVSVALVVVVGFGISASTATTSATAATPATSRIGTRRRRVGARTATGGPPADNDSTGGRTGATATRAGAGPAGRVGGSGA
jgi:hypothetical protein